MINESSFNINLEESIREHWRMSSLSDYDNITLKYSDVAEEIAKLHILFRETGIKKGDKIAICGSNMSRWAVCFLATLSYGAVAVPILHDFHPEQIHQLVTHCDARLLFVSDRIWRKLDAKQMPGLDGIVQINDYALLSSNNKKLENAATNLNRLFGAEYPDNFSAGDIKYHQDKPEELAIINYTSGTTSNPKGVMIPYRSLVGNVICADNLMTTNAKAGDSILSMLPMAHTFGMSFEFLYEFVKGIHIHFLTRVPTPTILLKALKDIRPVCLVCVPLIIEKVVRKAVMKKLEDPKMRLLLKTPIIGRKLKKRICDGIKEAFGGNYYEVVIGGAALNQEVEALLHDIGFNYTVGYGATECAPLIACQDWQTFRQGSCGRCVAGMELKVDSHNPHDIPGEILVRGRNLMLGYYKNPDATNQAIVDGWYHTGDLGVVDRQGNVFIKGRIKNLLLSSNGQNIYPEEIEDKLQNLPLVHECIVIQRADKLYGLVYPDIEEVKRRKLKTADINAIMEENR
jgi:long-chain acyl-CoA synthetase